VPAAPSHWPSSKYEYCDACQTPSTCTRQVHLCAWCTCTPLLHHPNMLRTVPVRLTCGCMLLPVVWVLQDLQAAVGEAPQQPQLQEALKFWVRISQQLPQVCSTHCGPES